MATKPSNCQFFYKKEHIQSKTYQIDYLSTYHVTSTWFSSSNSNLQMNYLNSCYHGNQKHNTISHFTKNGIYKKKSIFNANYLLPAGQNTNNFQHILHNLNLLNKYTNNSFKDSRLELLWQQLQEMPQKLLLYGQKWQILRFAQGKMWNWNLSGCYEFPLITFTTWSV